MQTEEEAAIRLQRVVRGYHMRNRFAKTLEAARTKTKVLEDFLQSETLYFDDLSRLHQISTECSNCLPSELHSVLFSGLSDIFQCTREMLEKFSAQRPITMFSYHSFVYGTLLMEQSSLFPSYSELIQLEQARVLALEFAKHTEVPFLQFAEKNPDLTKLLERVANRPSHYKKIAKSLLKHTGPDHKDYEALVEISKKLSSKPEFKTEEERTRHNMAKVTAQHAKFQHKLDIRPYRRWLFNSQVQIGNDACEIILYNDCLVLHKGPAFKCIFFSCTTIQGDISGNEPMKLIQGKDHTVISFPEPPICSLWFICSAGATFLWNFSQEKTVSTTHVWKKGYLKIQSKILNFPTWNSKYVVMKKNNLEIYGNESDQTPSESIPLANATLAAADRKTKKKYAFELRLPNRRANYFETESKEDLQEWMAAFEKRRFSELEDGSEGGTLGILIKNRMISAERYVEALHTDKAILKEEIASLKDKVEIYQMMEEEYYQLKKTNAENASLNSVLLQQIQYLLRQSGNLSQANEKQVADLESRLNTLQEAYDEKDAALTDLLRNNVEVEQLHAENRQLRMKLVMMIEYCSKISKVAQALKWIAKWLKTFECDLTQLTLEDLETKQNELLAYESEKKDMFSLLIDVESVPEQIQEIMKDFALERGCDSHEIIWKELVSSESSYRQRLEARKSFKENIPDVPSGEPSKELQELQSWIEEKETQIVQLVQCGTTDPNGIQNLLKQIKIKANIVGSLETQPDTSKIVGTLEHFIQMCLRFSTFLLEYTERSREGSAELWRQNRAQLYIKEVEAFLNMAKKLIEKPIHTQHSEYIKPTLYELKKLKMQWEEISNKMHFIDDSEVTKDEKVTRALLSNKLSQLEFLLKETSYHESPSLKDFENQVGRLCVSVHTATEATDHYAESMSGVFDTASKMRSDLLEQHQKSNKKNVNIDSAFCIGKIMIQNLRDSFEELNDSGPMDKENMLEFAEQVLKITISPEEIDSLPVGPDSCYNFDALTKLINNKKMWHLIGCTSEEEFMELLDQK